MWSRTFQKEYWFNKCVHCRPVTLRSAGIVILALLAARIRTHVYAHALTHSTHSHAYMHIRPRPRITRARTALFYYTILNMIILCSFRARSGNAPENQHAWTEEELHEKEKRERQRTRQQQQQQPTRANQVCCIPRAAGLAPASV